MSEQHEVAPPVPLARSNSSSKGGGGAPRLALPSTVSDKKEKKESVMNNYPVLFSYSYNLQPQAELQQTKPH